MKPTNHAHIESNVILSSRVNRRTSESSGRKANDKRQTTIALKTPSASAVKTLSFSIIDFPGAATVSFITVVIMRLSLLLHDR
ncbi:unannotated protein [freshwater metagenome]|uniref:Unannotated protein n=1 Tax=freshwater metagenome TaxID=449393 RepID=A0A6J6YNV9_9ZZZZ